MPLVFLLAPINTAICQEIIGAITINGSIAGDFSSGARPTVWVTVQSTIQPSSSDRRPSTSPAKFVHAIDELSEADCVSKAREKNESPASSPAPVAMSTYSDQESSSPVIQDGKTVGFIVYGGFTALPISSALSQSPSAARDDTPVTSTAIAGGSSSCIASCGTSATEQRNGKIDNAATSSEDYATTSSSIGTKTKATAAEDCQVATMETSAPVSSSSTMQAVQNRWHGSPASGFAREIMMILVVIVCSVLRLLGL